MFSSYFKKQDGYVLITVLIMFTIISILGLSLMSYTIGSYQFTKANSDFIETKSQAEMAAQEAEARIMKGVEEINNNLSNDTLELKDVISRIKNVLNQARTKLGDDGVLKEQVIKDGENGVFLERVDIEVGVPDSDRKLIKTITISTIADVFRYSAVTPGQLTLNGASYLKGDVQVGGDLRVDDEASFIYGRTYWVDTSFPGIEGELRVIGDFYRKNNYRDGYKFEPTTENLDRYFSITPKIITNTESVEEIKVSKLIEEKSKNEIRNGNGFSEQPGDLYINRDSTYETSLSITEACDWRYRWGEWRCYPYDDGDLVVGRGNQFHVKGDLLVNGNIDVNGTLSVEGSIYVNKSAELSGEIIVEEGGFMYIDDYTSIENLDLTGALYINGGLDTTGDINTNGTIYTKYGGDIRGMENDSGTLVVISDGPLTIANNNQYIDPDYEELKTIDAFFYTNSDLTMYGVGSNLVINGGIYGDNITLNAVKGDTKDEGVGLYGTHHRVGHLWFEDGQSSLSMNQSRFKVDYKEELILNPPEGIPTVKKISVKEIDTHFYED